MLTRLYRQHHPHATFGAANYVTLARALLTSVLLCSAALPPTLRLAWTAAWIAGTIAALDGVDGWLARRQRIASEFGARFDMEIDALLILVLAILVTEFEKAGPWVILSGLLRYIFVGAGKYWPRLRAPLFASRRRQAVCVVQILALNLAIVPAIQPPLSAAIAAVALAALAWSFLIDTRWLLRSAA